MQVTLTLAALLPAAVVAYATENVELLVSVTGGYGADAVARACVSRAAGVGIQYVIPALLVFYGRRTLAPLTNIAANPHRSTHPHIHSFIRLTPRSSMFARSGHVVVVCAWAAVSIVLVSLYLGLVYFPGLSSSSTDANPYCSD